MDEGLEGKAGNDKKLDAQGGLQIQEISPSGHRESKGDMGACLYWL